MKLALRAALAAVLILSLGLKFIGAGQTVAAANHAAAIATVLGARVSGPMTDAGWGSAANPSRVITVPVAGCADPMTIVTVIPPSFNSADALASFAKPGDRRYFAYLNWISREPDRWRMLGMRIWQRAREILGVSGYDHANTMLYIVEGAGCRAAEASVWERFWLKR